MPSPASCCCTASPSPAGGIPLLYLGDEVGTLNDFSLPARPGQGSDSRWVHRPARDQTRYAQRHNPLTSAGRMHAGLTHLIRLRKNLPALAGGALTSFWSGNPAVLGYLRQRAGETAVLVLSNFSENEQFVEARALGALPDALVDALSAGAYTTTNGLRLHPYQQVWLHIPEAVH